MIHDIHRRCIILERLERIHQTEDILRIIEISGSDILDLNNNGAESLDVIDRKFYMIGKRSQFRVSRSEDHSQIASFAEYVIHITSALRIPAVLGAETADLTFMESLVQLFFQRCGSE